MAKKSSKLFPKKKARKEARLKRRELKNRRIALRNKPEMDFIDDIELQEYEDEVVRQLFKKQTNIKRQITRRENKAAKEFSQKSFNRAEELNKALDIATDLQKNFKHGNGKYAQYLEPLMKRLKELGYDYELDNYNGNKNMLYKSVRFEELPDDQRVNDLVNKILSLNFSSYENYQNMLTENSAMSYVSNVQNSMTQDAAQNMAALEDVMNSSAAWAIAKKNAPDSEQTKANWVQLYSLADLAYKGGLLDKFIQEVISNPDFNTVETVETIITDALRNS